MEGHGLSRAANHVQHEALAAGVRFSLRHGDQADGGENGRVLLVFLNGQSFSFPGCRDILYDQRDVESATFVPG
jgi:hypothetical protein